MVVVVVVVCSSHCRYDICHIYMSSFSLHLDYCPEINFPGMGQRIRIFSVHRSTDLIITPLEGIAVSSTVLI